MDNLQTSLQTSRFCMPEAVRADRTSYRLHTICLRCDIGFSIFSGISDRSDGAGFSASYAEKEKAYPQAAQKREGSFCACGYAFFRTCESGSPPSRTHEKGGEVPYCTGVRDGTPADYVSYGTHKWQYALYGEGAVVLSIS